MPFVRTLVALLLVLPVAAAQVPTKPGVTVTLRFVAIDEADMPAVAKACAAMGVDLLKTGATLPADKLPKLLAALAQPGTHVLTAPQLQLANGRPGSFACGKEHRFTTAIERTTVKGQEVAVPKVETVVDGWSATVRGTIGADNAVTVDLKARHQSIEGPVELEPVTMLVTPAFEGGSQGKPVPFTQFVQKPRVKSKEFATAATLAGGTVAVFDGGSLSNEVRMESGPPVVSQIPYLNRLFKNQAIATVTTRVLVIATAEVVDVPATMEPLADYRTAVAEGRLADAKKFAEAALALDPACFAK